MYERLKGEPIDWAQHGSLPFRYKNYAELRSVNLPYWWFPYPLDWRESPHRKRLMRDIGLPDFWRKHGFPSHCRALGDDDFECDVLLPEKPRRRGWVN